MPKDACYHKVKSRYKVFPSAYASGAIAKCRKVGAFNYGTGGKKKKKRLKVVLCECPMVVSLEGVESVLLAILMLLGGCGIVKRRKVTKYV